MKKWTAALAAGLSLMLSTTAFAAVNADWKAGTVEVTSSYAVQTAAPAEQAGGDKTAETAKNGQAYQDYQAGKEQNKAAVADAHQQMMEYFRSVQMTGTQTVGQYIDANPDVKAKLESIITRANSDFKTAEKDATVTISLPIFGYGSLSHMVLPTIYQRAALPQPTKETAVAESYTGLIVECGDNTVTQALEPVIRDVSGREIYFYGALNWDKVLLRGMAAYVKGAESLDRAGANPLRVQAIGTADQGVTILVSVEDGDRILAANAKSDFFTPCAVVLHQK